MIKIQLTFILLCVALFTSKAQELTKFKTPGNYDQYVPVLFSFIGEPFSISRPYVHEDRNWLTYGIATINGIGFAWGSGNTKIKLENYSVGYKDKPENGNTYSFIGKVMSEWKENGLIVYLRGNSTYYTTGKIARNDGVYTAEVGSQKYLAPVPLSENSFSIHSGVYVGEMEINANTKSIDSGISNSPFSYKNNNIGLGTDNPESKFEIFNAAAAGHLRLSTDDNLWADSSRIDIDFHIKNKNQTISQISSVYYESGNGGTGGLKFSTLSNGELSQTLLLHPSGNAVLNGKLEAKEIKVTNSPTADFVFNKDYKLLSLSDVEKHIKEKKHLPEIASAKEMEKEGVNVGEFQIKLLQKIEELTLYMIEQSKINKEQNKTIKDQASEIENLKQEINQLKK